MCEICRGYERWIERLKAAEAGQQLTPAELQELRGDLEAALDEHVQAAGEASWNDDN